MVAGDRRALSFGATLLLALHTSHVRGRVIRVMTVVVGVFIVWQGVLAATGHEPFVGASYAFVLLIVASPAVILLRIFRHPVINVETILGAIDAYLLLGISFAAVYGALDDIDPHFFRQGFATGVQYLYFSFVVITTLGFGDFTPRTDLGRVVVSLEALFGQLFLVTVVAVLVANLGRAACRRGRDHGRDGRRHERNPTRSSRSAAGGRRTGTSRATRARSSPRHRCGVHGSSCRHRCRGRRGDSPSRRRRCRRAAAGSIPPWGTRRPASRSSGPC